VACQAGNSSSSRVMLLAKPSRRTFRLSKRRVQPHTGCRQSTTHPSAPLRIPRTSAAAAATKSTTVSRIWCRSASRTLQQLHIHANRGITVGQHAASTRREHEMTTLMWAKVAIIGSISHQDRFFFILSGTATHCTIIVGCFHAACHLFQNVFQPS
jgi:hypothetical protein